MICSLAASCCAQRCDGDRLCDGVARQREIGRGELVVLRVGERLLPLDLAANAAEHVERIAHVDAERVEIRRLAADVATLAQPRRSLPVCAGHAGDLGIEPPCAAFTDSRACTSVARADASVGLAAMA
jgi:hypothetical protein